MKDWEGNACVPWSAQRRRRRERRRSAEGSVHFLILVASTTTEIKRIGIGNWSELLCYLYHKYSRTLFLVTVFVTGNFLVGDELWEPFVLPAWMIRRCGMWLVRRGLILLALCASFDVERASVLAGMTTPKPKVYPLSPILQAIFLLVLWFLFYVEIFNWCFEQVLL